MKVSPDYYDEVFSFKGQWDMPSLCGLKIRQVNGRTYIIVTEFHRIIKSGEEMIKTITNLLHEGMYPAGTICTDNMQMRGS